MSKNPLNQLGALGQSIWLDYIRCDLIASGELRRMIEADGLRGMTSNPAIFENAIVKSHEYDDAIEDLRGDGKSENAIYETLSQLDVAHAADEFLSVYVKTGKKDGYVSLEVNPNLAHDTTGTIEEARRLWSALDRPNIMIKVPATTEGLPAIQTLISEGINVNCTLIFGLNRYKQVAEAYIAGIDSRLNRGLEVSHVVSVASFFVGRIDTLIDRMLQKIILQNCRITDLAKQVYGKLAISCAIMAYQVYKKIFCTVQFEELVKNGAQVQRLLWASTTSKTAAVSDIKYVEALIGPDTVNTLSLQTLNAYRDHGVPKIRLEHEVEIAAGILVRLKELDISIDSITQQLEDEGIEKFKVPFDSIMRVLSQRKNSISE